MSELDARALKAQLDAVRKERDAVLARLDVVRDERDQLDGLRSKVKFTERMFHASERRVRKLEAVAAAARVFSNTWEMRDSSYTPLAEALAALDAPAAHDGDGDAD